MSIADKLTTIAENEQKVYETGEDNGIDMMWEFLQNGGKRVLYSAFFRELVLSEETVKPKYDIAPTTATLMFYQAKLPQSGKPLDIAEVEEKCGIKFDFSKVANMESFAQATDAISRFNVIDLSSATNTYGVLWNCYGLKRVEKIIVSENTTFLAHAIESSNLEHCPFEGVIAKNGLTLQGCKKLDRETLLSVINCLKDYSADTSGTVWKITFGSDNIAKLTETELDEIRVKGWTYA